MSTSDLRRHAKLLRCPEFIKVPRAALRLAGLGERDALALGLVLFRDRVGSRVLASDVAEVFDFDRWTSGRTLDRLRERGLLDARGAPSELALAMGEGSFLKVRTADVRHLGKVEAIVLAQLPSLPTMHVVKKRDGFIELPARLLSELIGCCADTALDVLDRLSTGMTTRVKRALSKGEQVVVKPLLKLVRSAGSAFRVRMLTEREQQPQTTAPAPKAPARASTSKPAAVTPEVPYMPSMEELTAMMSAAGARARRA